MSKDDNYGGFGGWSEHEYASYLKQADDTLALILKGYGVTHVHDECGVICKIAEVENLLESSELNKETTRGRDE